MKTDELARHDGMGLAELIRRREVSAAEVLDATIAAVEARNPEINAVICRLYDQARAAVAAGLPAGPFTGVPYLLKDLGAHYQGAVTSCGGTLFKDFVLDHDSEITVRRLKRAGLVIFGKTNTPELGLASSTEPRLFGPTRNPWNPAHSAGGSSGGSAAAVAAGMVPMAHATDGGGSIRIPASACGLFGLKPTRARNPMGPDQGEGWGGASVGHAVTRTRARQRGAARRDVRARRGRSLLGAAARAARSSRRSGAIRGGCASPSRRGPGTARRWIRSARRPPARRRGSARASGTRWRRRARTSDAGSLGAATLVIIGANLRAALEARAAALGRELDEARRRAHHVDHARWTATPPARPTTPGPSGSCTAPAVRWRRSSRATTCCYRRPCAARRIRSGVIDMMTGDPVGYGQAVLGTIAFTSLWNACGNPAMSVPLAWSRAGLPLGVQFVGALRRRGDALPAGRSARGGAAVGGAAPAPRGGRLISDQVADHAGETGSVNW